VNVLLLLFWLCYWLISVSVNTSWVFGVADGQAEGTAAVYIEIRSCQGELLLPLLFGHSCKLLRSTCLYLCLLVCPRAYLKNQMSKRYQKLTHVAYGHALISSALAALRYVMYFRFCG